MDAVEFEKEKENLKSIIKKYEEVIDYYNQRLEVIPKLYKNNIAMMQNSIEMCSAKLRLMEKT